MANDVNNIIVKNATLTVGTYLQAEGSAHDVGALDGGVAVENTREYADIKADPWIGIIAKKKTGEVMIVKCVMAESSLANLAIAFDYPVGAVVGSEFSFGGDITANYRTLYINGDGPGGGTRKWTLWKCVSVGSGGHSYKKDEKTMIEVEFQVLEDTTKAANERYGSVLDAGADTTAPTVVLTTPADGDTVTKNTKGTVLWTITEANGMDESTIVYGDNDGATFMILNTTTPASASLVAGSIAYDSTAKTVTFTPTSDWTASDTFQAIVTTGLKDAAGNNLATPKIEQFSVTA